MNMILCTLCIRSIVCWQCLHVYTTVTTRVYIVQMCASSRSRANYIVSHVYNYNIVSHVYVTTLYCAVLLILAGSYFESINYGIHNVL